MTVQDAMSWARAHEVLAEVAKTGHYDLVQLSADDLPALLPCLPLWYPDIVVGAESVHLDPAFYTREVALAGAPLDRPIFPILVKHGPVPIALVTYEMNALSRTISSRLGVIDPAHRGSGLALLGPILLERLGRAIGAELAYYFATLKTKHQQVLAERSAYTLVGIVPGYDRDMVRPGEVRRVYEAVYAKVLVAPEQVSVPTAAVMTAKTREVWRALFGADPAQE